MSESIKRVLRNAIHKGLLLDLEDGLRGEAVKAHTVVRDHSGLNTKRAREAEGQLRFRMMEQRFEQVCELHGWKHLDGGLIPHTDLKVFQPFMRQVIEDQGVILGMAAIPEPRALPPTNKSRRAGVTCNYELIPHLDLDGTGPKIGDIFALLLVSRDRDKAGQIEEVAIGVIDAQYEGYIFYETLDKFLGDSEETDDLGPTPFTPPPLSATVSLKKRVAPFVPPEKRDENGQEETGTK